MTKSSARKRTHKVHTYNINGKPPQAVSGSQQRVTNIVKPTGGRAGVRLSFLKDGGNGSLAQSADDPDPAVDQICMGSDQGQVAMTMADATEETLEQAYVEYLENIEGDPIGKRKRPPGDEPLMSWVGHRDRYLELMINLEARVRDRSGRCCTCKTENENTNAPLYECVDCFNRLSSCQECILFEHRYLPLHRIRKWNGTYFDKVTLKSLGLRVQLGHQRGEKCLRPKHCHDDDFVVLDTHGIHSVGIDFCGCGKSMDSRTDQLLAACLFPATVQEPRTALTFRLLEAFELLSYESKASSFEVYQTISRLTDNTGTHRPKDRYMVFLRVTKEWRHLRLLKRAGRGHDPRGVDATMPGECALLCPACPQPGKNMAPNWQTVPKSERQVPQLIFLHALFLAIDGNFRLKRKQVSSDSLDPGLGRGYAYFVEEMAFKEYLSGHVNDAKPVNTCSRHDAVRLSETKPNRGHAATGVITIECSRHDMKRPNAIGDMQVGERYCITDYLLRHSLQSTESLKTIVISYDIACQWSINFFDRIAGDDPGSFLLNDDVYILFVVPKFHLPAHTELCQTRRSLNLIPGVGRTDGEAPERGWAEINPLAASTREMGPGSCRDALDSHFGDYNWRKIVGLGHSLARHLWKAAFDMAEFTILHTQLSETIPPSVLEQWTKEVEGWEADSEQPNPFELTRKIKTQAAIRRELAEKEAQDLATGKDFTLDNVVTPSVLISTGIDLETQQRSLQRELSQLWEHAQDRQHARAVLHQSTLRRKIEAWISIQTLYIPTVTILRQKTDSTDHLNKLPEQKSYEIPLLLPSEIKRQLNVDVRLYQIEWDLRIGQANEALEAVRHGLQIRAHLYRFKAQNVRGQIACTRTQNAIAQAQSRINTAVAEYRVARRALESLAPIVGQVGWAVGLRPLNDTDVRELCDDDEGVSSGRKKLSWIWTMFDNKQDVENNAEFRGVLRVEWCKSRARTNRFQEEVGLLTEEMNRVVRFLRWEAHDWSTKGARQRWTHVTEDRFEALHAYAMRQVAIREALVLHFLELWKTLPAHVALMRSAIKDPNILAEFKENELEENAKSGRLQRKRGKQRAREEAA